MQWLNTRFGEGCGGTAHRCLLAAILGLALITVDLAAAQAKKIDFSARAIAFGADAMPRLLGRLEFLSAHELNSEDSRFGGFSGLRFVDAGKKLVAVSDKGRALILSVTRSATGAILELKIKDFFPLRDSKKKSLGGTLLNSDAESLAYGPGGSLLVAFERRHRILQYRTGILSGAGGRFLKSKLPLKMAFNEGLETMLQLPGGGIFAIAEYFDQTKSGFNGFRLKSGKQSRFVYRSKADYQPVDGMALKNGNLLILERSYRAPFFISSRIVEIDARNIWKKDIRGRLVADWGSERIAENFEGLAIVEWRGQTLVHVISDDNFNFFQSTYLITFRLNKAE